MASSCEKLDQLVKDYLLFRGFSSTLKTLDQELRTDKDKGLRVDRMMEQIWTLLSAYDLQGLREYWRYLNQRLFSRLEQRYALSVRKLESGLLKLYVVNAHQSGKQDKVLAFFEQMGPELQNHPDFKEWFVFPFVANPVDNPAFTLYFNKQWQDTLQLSLHNFLSVVLQAMPVPTLLNVEFDARRMKTLQEENISLKQSLMNASQIPDQTKEGRSGGRSKTLHSELHPPSSPPDMVYDFSGLTLEPEPSNDEKQKPARRFPLSLASPLVGRKKSDAGQGKAKASAPPAISAAPPASSTTSSSIGIQGKSSKVTEMAVFPPMSSMRASSEGRRSTVASVSSSSSSAYVTGMHKHSAGSKQGPMSSRQSPVQSKQTTSAGDAASMASNTVAASSSSQPASRSLSVPDGKALKNKPEMVKRSSETSMSAVQGTRGDSPAGGSGLLDSSVDSDSVSICSLANETESPFLLLEDEYSEHSSAATFCRFSLTGQYVASLDVDGIVKVWMWSPQPATTATVMSRSAFLSVAWASKSDRWLLLGNKTGTIRLFDVKESKTYREVLVNPDNPTNCMRVTDLATSPSSMQFVCATSDLCPFTSDPNSVTGRLLQWDLRTLKLERALLVDSTVCNAVTCSAYSPNGSMLLTGGADGYIRLYDSQQQKPAAKWHGHDSPIHTVQYNGDRSVFSMSADGKLCEWSLTHTGQLMTSLSTGPRDIGKVTSGSCRGRLFSLDREQHYLLTYLGKRGTIYKIFDVSSPTCVMELKSHQSPVVTVDWSPSQDTCVCLTSSADGKIKISTLLSK